MANSPLPEIFTKVSLKIDPSSTLFPGILKDKKIEYKDGYVSGSFGQVEEIFQGLTAHTLNNTDRNVGSHTLTGFGSAKRRSLPLVEIDKAVMRYIRKIKSEQYERIKRNGKVSIEQTKSHLIFSSMTGESIHAQLAQEQFITLYQKTATGLQTRTYDLDPNIMPLISAEFPELLIDNRKDKVGLTLTGSFINLDTFEASYKAKGPIWNQIPNSLRDYRNQITTRDYENQQHTGYYRNQIPNTVGDYGNEILNTTLDFGNKFPNTTRDNGACYEQSAMREKSIVEAKEETCPICFETIKKDECEVLTKCKHCFCKDCIKRAFQEKPACPICGEIYGSLTGTQPKGGSMNVSTYHSSLPGYEQYGTITISYCIPSGLQGDEHPNPGQSYQGASRTAYLPDSPEGRKVLKLLERAFKQQLTFTIGRSSTTGINNVVTWNDIHHKTSRTGGPTHYGYPDPEYLNRVQDELKAKGIY